MKTQQPIRTCLLLFLTLCAMAAGAQPRTLKPNYLYRFHQNAASAGFESVASFTAPISINLSSGNISCALPSAFEPQRASAVNTLQAGRSYQLLFRKRDPGVLADFWQIEMSDYQTPVAALHKVVLKGMPGDTAVTGYYAELPEFKFTAAFRRDKRLDDSEYSYGKDLMTMYKAIRRSKLADESNRFLVRPDSIVWEHYRSAADPAPEFRKLLAVSAKDTHVLTAEDQQQIVFKCVDEENPDKTYQLFFGRNPKIDPLKDTAMMVVTDEEDRQFLYVFYN